MSALDLRSIFWGNLLLLGLQPVHYPGVTLHRDMFAGHTGASKSMEVVLRFLFGTLDPVLSKERFAKCWPIVDRGQGREFRNVAVKWLEFLKKEGHIPSDVLVRRSYFDECRGERFERVLLALSHYVLKVSFERSCGSNQNVSLSRPQGGKRDSLMEELRMKALKVRITAVAHDFLAEEKTRTDLQTQWKSYAEQLTNDYQDLVCRKKDAHLTRSRLQEELQTAFDSSKLEDALSQRANTTSRISAGWTTVIDWMKENRRNMDMTEDILKGHTSDCVLENTSMCFELPSGLQNGDGRVTTRPYVDGRLDLTAITRLWSIAQFELLKTLQGSVLNPTSECDQRPSSIACSETPDLVADQLCKQETLLARIRTLKSDMQTQLVDIRASIAANRSGVRSKYDDTPPKQNREETSDTILNENPGPDMDISTPTVVKIVSELPTPEAVAAINDMVRSEVTGAMDAAASASIAASTRAMRERLVAAASSRMGIIDFDSSHQVSSNKDIKVTPPATPKGHGRSSRLLAPTVSSAAKCRTRPPSKASEPCLGSPSRTTLQRKIKEKTTNSSKKRVPDKQGASASQNVSLVKSRTSNSPRRSSFTRTSTAHSQREPTVAYDLLCEQIVNFVHTEIGPVPQVPSAPAGSSISPGRVDQLNFSDTHTGLFQDDLNEMTEPPENIADPIAALGNQGFHPQKEIARTPEKSQNQTLASNSVRGSATSARHTSSRVNAYRPKTPSKLSQIVTFDSSSDSLLTDDNDQSDKENLERSPDSKSPRTRHRKSLLTSEKNNSYGRMGKSPNSQRKKPKQGLLQMLHTPKRIALRNSKTPVNRQSRSRTESPSSPAIDFGEVDDWLDEEIPDFLLDADDELHGTEEDDPNFGPIKVALLPRRGSNISFHRGGIEDDDKDQELENMFDKLRQLKLKTAAAK
ncbi:uncharacterized protein SPPG_08015 [Spizellomyces punctatus DAOM BR117]|uniref:HAUS augmin-like complex subunit 6 N-terminal domain-containing protein n=1 Tax=Spizellomyces punctatus (strain DAOM BR117) TaxID=645134 RepID=A0A0L0H769_SPIPD|nr:uncharacterized protein SPPG_08015 [Spizellomyces punctatus DAOM BR117]KNC96814.1 hypothetical protein SPPG_08015 [Spizellomyces punctatus DAOM BR117]|eukprot:XP_016604854.1 hypothetical protein SPPG_08015 [Spizellomyces punctatus DAOM BR117]